MGQKVHPYGFRLGVTKTWRSRWFAKQDYSKLLHEDLELKENLRERLKSAGLTEEQLARLHGPIGLDLGAQSPEEIGVAVLAQIIAAKNGKLVAPSRPARAAAAVS